MSVPSKMVRDDNRFGLNSVIGKFPGGGAAAPAPAPPSENLVARWTSDAADNLFDGETDRYA